MLLGPPHSACVYRGVQEGVRRALRRRPLGVGLGSAVGRNWLLGTGILVFTDAIMFVGRKGLL